jgi:hypothetical protein
MPDPDRIVRLLQRASAAFRSTPGRTGRLVTLHGATEVMVAGDLHGHVGHFQEILRRADLPGHPGRHLVLQELIHGPFHYADGSDKSHQLMDLVAALKCQFPERVHYLPGNHEYAQATGRPISRSGGELNSLFRAGVEHAYGSRAVHVYAAYLDMIRAAPLALRTDNRVFISHSLPPETRLAGWSRLPLLAEQLPDGELAPEGSIYQLLWGRDLSAQAARGFLSAVDSDLLVTGHIPCDEGYMVPNEYQIVVDCQEPPAGYCLFPADRPLSHQDLVAGAAIL